VPFILGCELATGGSATTLYNMFFWTPHPVCYFQSILSLISGFVTFRCIVRGDMLEESELDGHLMIFDFLDFFLIAICWSCIISVKYGFISSENWKLLRLVKRSAEMSRANLLGVVVQDKNP
jgi:hypothetical protein